MFGGGGNAWRSFIEDEGCDNGEGEIVGGSFVEVGGFEGAELVGDGKAEVEQAPTEKAVEACCGFEQSHIWRLKFEAVVKEFPLVVLSEKSAPHRIHLEEGLGLGPR